MPVLLLLLLLILLQGNSNVIVKVAGMDCTVCGLAEI